MSDIRVKDLSARATLRLGRTYQVNALAPFPVRPPLQLWQPWRRGFVHGAADLGAGFGFGGDSNLLRRLKMGLAAEDADQAIIDSLTDADVTRDARGVKVKPSALARLPAAIRAKIARPETAPKLQNWFFERRPAQKLARQATADRDADYEDTGAGDVETLKFQIGADTSSQNSRLITPPIRITNIYVVHTSVFSAVAGEFFEWSVNPPGISDAGSSTGVQSAFGAIDGGTSINVPCDVLATTTPVILRATARTIGAGTLFTILISVSYTRLRRKALGTL